MKDRKIIIVLDKIVGMSTFRGASGSSYGVIHTMGGEFTVRELPDEIAAMMLSASK